MDLYRSRSMKYVAITITNESTYNTIQHIGRFELFHVVDLNDVASTTQQPNKNILLYKKKLNDIITQEKLIQSIYQQINQFNVKLNTSCSVNELPTTGIDVHDYVVSQIQPLQAELTLSVHFQQEVLQSINKLIEQKAVINVLQNVDLRDNNSSGVSGTISSSSVLSDDSSELIDMDDIEQSAGNEQHFRNLISGTIAVAQQAQLQRAIYRASRGNAYTRFVPINDSFTDPITQQSVDKSVFYVIVLGQVLYEKLIKIADLLHANVISVSTDKREYNRLLQHLTTQIAEQRLVHQRTQQQIIDMLQRVSDNDGSCPLRDYEYALYNEKLICEVYMKSHYYLTMMSIEGWCPTENIKQLTAALKQAVAGTGQPCAAIEVDPVHPIKLPGSPPTYFITNKFTETYQGIVDTYGVPRYKGMVHHMI